MPLTFAEPITILLVEDNPVDAKIAVAAVNAAGVVAEVDVVADGVAALECLRDTDGAGRARCLPDVILLDLSLPRMRGIDVLAELAGDESLSRIPVVVLTGSEDRDDVLLEARRQVRHYQRKPIDPHEFARILHQIENRARLERLRQAITPIPPTQRTEGR